MYGLTVLPVRHTQLLFSWVPHTVPIGSVATHSVQQSRVTIITERELKMEMKRKTNTRGNSLTHCMGVVTEQQRKMFTTQITTTPSSDFISGNMLHLMIGFHQNSNLSRRKGKSNGVRKKEGELWHIPDTLMTTCLHCSMLTSFTSTDCTSICLCASALWGFWTSSLHKRENLTCQPWSNETSEHPRK